MSVSPPSAIVRVDPDAHPAATGESSVSTHSISRLLQANLGGDESAKARLVAAIYGRLKVIARDALARERHPLMSLTETELAHEAYLRLEANALFVRAQNRRHLFGALQRAARQVLVDRARYRNAQKRQGQWKKVPLDEQIDRIELESRTSLIDLDSVLKQLDRDYPQVVEIVQLRIFGQLKMREIARLLGVSLSKVEADFRFARAIMRQALTDGASHPA